MKSVRCAIYTRKSSDEGLQQDFNSLDAQREACAAYVRSQASEGWKLLPQHYDDGGLSGGTLERPALQSLLADVKAGRIDIIVVYKVDRLTRSLLDFAKLVETFDGAGTSFVSVTQSFNTTTSMGRLTLNMLLSFAQFEREVTAERIRDKIAASKARGMWMGGIPPLGYRPEGRSLAIVEEHAELVRTIFSRYCELGNVRILADQLAAEGVLTPRRVTGTGKRFGGCRFTRGQLYCMLRNPVYIGQIRHKGTIHPGKHPPIIDADQWSAVQLQLADNVRGVRHVRSRNAALLAGLLIDGEGQPLVCVHATKGSQRYRYYVSKAQHHRTAAPDQPALRLPAHEIEQIVCREIGTALSDPLRLVDRLGITVPPAHLHKVIARCQALKEPLGQSQLLHLLDRVVVKVDSLELSLNPQSICELLDLGGGSVPEGTLYHEVALALSRTGRGVRLVQEDGALALPRNPDPTLIRLLITARSWWAELASGELDISTLSIREGVTASWMTRVVRLAFLSPQVTEAILRGATRAGIEGKELLATGAIDADWATQARRILPVVMTASSTNHPRNSMEVT